MTNRTQYEEYARDIVHHTGTLPKSIVICVVGYIKCYRFWTKPTLEAWIKREVKDSGLPKYSKRSISAFATIISGRLKNAGLFVWNGSVWEKTK
jgi:hypothetical protein